MKVTVTFILFLLQITFSLSAQENFLNELDSLYGKYFDNYKYVIDDDLPRILEEQLEKFKVDQVNKFARNENVNPNENEEVNQLFDLGSGVIIKNEIEILNLDEIDLGPCCNLNSGVSKDSFLKSQILKNFEEEGGYDDYESFFAAFAPVTVNKLSENERQFISVYFLKLGLGLLFEIKQNEIKTILNLHGSNGVTLKYLHDDEENDELVIPIKVTQFELSTDNFNSKVIYGNCSFVTEPYFILYRDIKIKVKRYLTFYFKATDHLTTLKD